MKICVYQISCIFKLFIFIYINVVHFHGGHFEISHFEPDVGILLIVLLLIVFSYTRKPSVYRTLNSYISRVYGKYINIVHFPGGHFEIGHFEPEVGILSLASSTHFVQHTRKPLYTKFHAFCQKCPTL